MKLSGVQFTGDAKRVEVYGRDRSRGTHGSTFQKPGQTHVYPADRAGVDVVHTGVSHPDKAYYTAHEYYNSARAESQGWSWANQAAAYSPSREGSGLGRPVVHDVQPMRGSTVDQDPYTKQWNAPDQASLVSDKGLRITDTHWIPPPKEGSKGIQGTLPNVNWNQFGGEGQQNWRKL